MLWIPIKCANLLTTLIIIYNFWYTVKLSTSDQLRATLLTPSNSVHLICNRSCSTFRIHLYSATGGGVRAEMVLPHTQPLWKPLRSTCISSARLEGGRSLIMPEIKSLDIWNRVWLISFATPAVAWGANAATTNCYIMFIWAATVSLSGKLSCWKAVVTSSIYWWDIQWLNQIVLVLL